MLKGSEKVNWRVE
jgi:ribonuclease HI